MELAQSLLALPGQGKQNSSAQIASRSSSVSTNISELPSVTTADKSTQETNSDVAGFGNLLTYIFDTTQADTGASNKNSLFVDVKNFSALQTASAVTTAPSAAITSKPVLSKNPVAPQSGLASLSLLSAQTNLQNGLNNAAQAPTQDAQSTVLNSNIETPVVTKTATAEHKALTLNPQLSEALPAQSVIPDTPLINSPASFAYESTLSSESTASQFMPLADKLLNSTAIISTPVATDTAQGNPPSLSPAVAPAGEVTLNSDTSTGTGDGKLKAASKKNLPDVPINTTGAAPVPIAGESGQTPTGTSQTSTSAHGALATKVSDQIVASENPTETLTDASNTAPQNQSSDNKTSTPTISVSEAPTDARPPDSPAHTLDDNADAQTRPSPTISAVTQPTLSPGQVLPPADMVQANMAQATGNILAGEMQQASTQGKAPTPPLHDPLTDRNSAPTALPAAAPAAQAQVATSPQLTGADIQSFSQALAQKPDGLSISTPQSEAPVVSGPVTQDETGNLIILDKPESVRTSITPTIARPEAPSHPVSPPIRDIALHISQHVDNGINRFQLRLDPPELGRVDVRMEISSDGKLTAVIAVERPETLDLLQRDSRALERSLMDAGLKTDSNALSFSLKGGRHDNQNSGRSNPGFDKTAADPMEDWDDSVAPTIGRFANRSVNIRI
ncbi:MAG: flagellar hook-length control protein FliK [Alphaproteobacteria bacterium]|nr:flagellar hook-length control protein FliK [Alphaproteobacteria bacterium]